MWKSKKIHATQVIPICVLTAVLHQTKKPGIVQGVKGTIPRMPRQFPTLILLYQKTGIPSIYKNHVCLLPCRNCSQQKRSVKGKIHSRSDCPWHSFSFWLFGTQGKWLIVAVLPLWYNWQATAPRQVEKGGESHERITHIFFSLCFGKCSRLLHLQMAGRRRIAGSQPWD